MGKATATSKIKLTQSDADDLAVLAALKEAARSAQRIATSNRLKVVSVPASVGERSERSRPLRFAEARQMGKTQKACGTSKQMTLPSEPEIRAAMGKAVREVRRNDGAKNMTLLVAGKNSWSSNSAMRNNLALTPGVS